MKRYVDLHMHTNYSDGVKTPSELLELVRSTKVAVFSVTDHDNLDGYKKMKELVTENDPELISGLELSSTLDDADMHILAYQFDAEYEPLNDILKEFQANRNSRGKAIVDKLNEFGLDLKFSVVEKIAEGASVGRPHIAKALVDTGLVSTYELAFEKYIRDDGPAFVHKKNFRPVEAIKLIHDAGGLAFLAHPGIGEKEKYIEMLIENGLDGIEIYHPSHRISDIDRLKHLAERHRLFVCGGSDFHGIDERHSKVGSQRAPYDIMSKWLEKN